MQFGLCKGRSTQNGLSYAVYSVRILYFCGKFLLHATGYAGF
jgi:hypothetical protein